MVVAEALARGVPVIASRGTPWQDLITNQCGWWVESEIETLSQALFQATALDSCQLQAMGQRGRDWMARDFGWPALAQKMQDAYAWILNAGDCPPWVKEN
jgi:glycosyltransferase involved in cell wall biosynthesis